MATERFAYGASLASQYGEVKVILSRSMQSIWDAATLLAILVTLNPVAANAQSAAGDEAAITAVLSTYQDALNASSTAAAMPLYTDDGVFMPPYSQSAIGKTQLKEAYDSVFKNITLHVKFTVREVVIMSPQWAFARTNSAGTNKVNATGATSAEGNQELFIFKKGSDGKWRIARYSFSSTNPPPNP